MVQHMPIIVTTADSKAFLLGDFTAFLGASRQEAPEPAVEKEWKHQIHITQARDFSFSEVI